jgi:citrate lyase subunit beta / citryl-CoA lyase
MDRSYLFAPGHKERLLAKVFDAGADAVILDLEDAVPPDFKDTARAMVADTLADHQAWVRINAIRSPEAAADLAAVGDLAYGIRIPKVESVADVHWVAERIPGKPLLCAIETAKGVVNAVQIAEQPSVAHLALGGIDLQTDLGVASGGAPLQYVRSHLVLAARAAGIGPPIDSVYPLIYDDQGLRQEATLSRSFGFFGKSAVHPAQLPVIHAVFDPGAAQVEWAQQVLAAFDASNGAAVRMPSGEFVDRPVAERARDILQLARTAPESLG